MSRSVKKISSRTFAAGIRCTIPLTGLDLLYNNNLISTGLAVYNTIPDLDRLYRAIGRALGAFPSFSGQITHGSAGPCVKVGDSSLHVDLYETRESLLSEIPLTDRKLVKSLGFIEQDEVMMRERRVFALILAVNAVEKSSVLVWKTAHCHTDGHNITRFLKKISDVYHAEVSDDREIMNRYSAFEDFLQKDEKAGNRYIRESEPNPLACGSADVEVSSALIALPNNTFDFLDREAVSERKLLQALMLKIHAKCIKRTDFFDMEVSRVLDIRAKEVFDRDYSGNALITERCSISTEILLSENLSHIYDVLESRMSWDFDAAVEAVALLEKNKRKRDFLFLEALPDPGFLPGKLLGGNLEINDISFFGIHALDFGSQPLWFDIPRRTSACEVVLLPLCLSEEFRYVRVYGPAEYVGDFISRFYETLGVSYY